MTFPAVALTRCADYGRLSISRAMQMHFELNGGCGKFVRSGDTVLLKPNFIAPRSHRYATQTNPAIIIELARILKDIGARPIVGDSPAWGNVYECVKALGLKEPLEKLSVPVLQLNKPVTYRLGSKNTKIGISSIALDADVIINLPKFKSHQQLLATFAVKNMFGCVSGKRKAYLHFTRGKNYRDFCEILIEIYKLLRPALTIIDAVQVMDGPGPINGRTRPFGYIISGTDPIACETICAKLIGIDQQQLPIVRTAELLGFGCSDFEKIKITGDKFPETICRDFIIPKLIPLGFSLPHVFKSLFKQILLLGKSALKKTAASIDKRTVS